MRHLLDTSIVRIKASEGGIAGTGVLVGPYRALTCAHVVASALGLPDDAQEAPPNAVRLDVPLADSRRTLTARVTYWDAERDVAVLELTDDPPDDAQLVPLVTADDLWGHHFRAFGCPSGYEDGVWASGVLRGQTAAGWVQIEDVKEPGYWVQPGFSGTPIWDEQLEGVAGIAVAADTDRATKAAFMIPTQALIEAWPELAERSLEAGSLEHIQMQLARLEKMQHRAADPSRFQPQIDALQERIAAWGGRVERQRERIAEGLEEQRRQRIEEQARRREGAHLRVVGQPPLGAVDYFKNRWQEQKTIGQLLAEPSTRLVSVIGHGGMGKTALACKVLQDLERHRWPHTGGEAPIDGVVYLSTRTAGISLERLFLDCARLLGGEMQEQINAMWTNPQLENREKVSRLLESLSDGRCVILLDNLEDLLDDQGQITDDDVRLFFNQSLMVSQGAQLVVTSRVALAFRREVMRLDRQVKLLEGLPIDDGVALLRELDPNGDYGLRDAAEEQLAEAVEMAHGVPRALEVLAGILANDPFATLDEVMETFYEQEDVVQALIEENYRRLDQDARRVIEALAVFRKPVPPLAVDYLLEPFAPGLDVPGIVQRLTRTNIVSVDRAAKTVTLHPIDQDYAYSQLPEEEEAESDYTRQALERRAADYYVRLRTPEETWESIDDLEPQLNEFEHRVRAGDCDAAYRLLEAIDSGHLHLWGHYDRLIAMREALLTDATSQDVMASNLSSLGQAYYSRGEIDWAIELYEQALAIESIKGSARWRSTTLRRLGRAYHVRGQVTRAVQLYEDSLDIICSFQPSGLQERGILLGDLGLAYHHQVKIGQALGYYEIALSIAYKIDDHQYKNLQIGRMGIAYLDLGRVDQAIELFQQTLSIARGIGDLRYESAWLSYLGIAYRLKGRIGRAIEAFERGLNIVREIGDRRGEGIHLSRYGLVYRDMDQERNLDFQRRALAIGIEDVREKSYQLVRLGTALLAMRRTSRAYEVCQEALNLSVPVTKSQAELTLGIIRLYQRDSGAEKAFVDAIGDSRSLLDRTSTVFEQRYTLATALVGQAVCDPRWEEPSQRPNLLVPALEEYRRALEITAAPGVVQDAIRDLELIQAAGIEGLEPAFELLENAEYEPDLPEDLPDILEVDCYTSEE